MYATAACKTPSHTQSTDSYCLDEVNRSTDELTEFVLIVPHYYDLNYKIYDALSCSNYAKDVVTILYVSRMPNYLQLKSFISLHLNSEIVSFSSHAILILSCSNHVGKKFLHTLPLHLPLPFLISNNIQ